MTLATEMLQVDLVLQKQSTQEQAQIMSRQKRPSINKEDLCLQIMI
jgi:hypothetical protein